MVAVASKGGRNSKKPVFFFRGGEPLLGFFEGLIRVTSWWSISKTLG